MFLIWGTEKNPAMLNARFESAEATFVAGTIWLEGAVLAFDSVCKIFEALIIKICVSCGSSSISDINLFHALHYAQPRSTRRLLLQGASKLDCTPSLDKYFPLLCLWTIATKLYYFVPQNRFSVRLTMCICWAMAQARCPGRVLKLSWVEYLIYYTLLYALLLRPLYLI